MQNYIYGAGGHGKVVLDAMQTANLSCDGFVDDVEALLWMRLKVCKLSDLSLGPETYLHLAIGSCKARESLTAYLKGAMIACAAKNVPVLIFAVFAMIAEG